MDTRTPQGGSADYVGLLIGGTSIPIKTPPDAYSGVWQLDWARRAISTWMGGRPPSTHPTYLYERTPSVNKHSVSAATL